MTSIYSFLQGGTGWSLSELQNDFQQTTGVNVSEKTIRNRLYEEPTSSKGLHGHCRAQWNQIGICHRIPQFVPKLAPCVSHRSQQVHPQHTWKSLDNHGECYTACNVIQHDWVGSRSLIIRGGITMERRTDLYSQWATAPWLALGIKMKSLDPLSDPILVQRVLNSTWCPTMLSLTW